MKQVYEKLLQIAKQIEEAYKLATTEAEKEPLRKAWADVLELQAESQKIK